jgi:riboflavin synthase
MVRIRVVSSKDEISDLSPNETIVHITFRPSGIDLMYLMKTCPRLRAIQVSPAYKKNLSKATKSILDIQGVDLIEGYVWGHRTDIDEYYVIDEGVVKEIVDLTATGKSIDEVVTHIKNSTKLSPEMIKYIAKQKMVV